MIKYDSAAQQIIHSFPAPYKGIIFDIVDYPDKNGIIVLRLYADNIFSFSENQMLSIFEWINSLCDRLNSLPLLAKYTWECVDYDQR